MTADPATDSAIEVERSVVRVFAAASLTDAFTALGSAFEQEHPNFDVELNLAGSSSLQAQIVAGAPADVLASANEAVMDQLVDEPSIEIDQPEIFTTNRLALAVPIDNPAAVTGLDDFARQELFLGLCAAEVPCGSLADQILAAHGVSPAVDTREPDVRALLAKVATGELDAGIVYATDVQSSADQVESIAIDGQLQQAEFAARYPIAALEQGENPGGGRAFVSFVLSDAGHTILSDLGFGAPTPGNS